jgi:hypothetical protein
VENVREQQLLMLLLVVQSDLDDREDAFRCLGWHLPNQSFDGGIDMRPVGCNFRTVRARDQAPLRPRVTRTGGDIVRVEKKRKPFVEDPVRGSCGTRRNCSKNQVTCARCHLAGLASAID